MLPILAVTAHRFAVRSRVRCSTSAPAAAEVLHFWLGPDWSTRGDPERKRVRMWFSRNADVDATARTFIPLIRAAGQSQLDGREWSTRDGLVAQLVLLDQLSRNAFRGEAEAFAYDERAAQVASRLIHMFRHEPHALPASAALFVVTCLSHSEQLGLHNAAERFAAAHVAASGSEAIGRQLDHDLPQHTRVLRRFGRYPHRNEQYGRQTTLEEQAWLASEDCPGWARSQALKTGAKDETKSEG